MAVADNSDGHGGSREGMGVYFNYGKQLMWLPEATVRDLHMRYPQAGGEEGLADTPLGKRGCFVLELARLCLGCTDKARIPNWTGGCPAVQEAMSWALYEQF